MKRSILGAGLCALALPATAGAHVTVHPNVVPAGAFTVLHVRVPNETDNANTTKVQVQMPEGFADVATDPPPGWDVKTRSAKAATPIKTDDGEVNTEVKEVTFSGGSIPPGQFADFGLSVGIPGQAGSTLTFKALQTYSDGKVVRWIGAPDADEPAPTISVSAKDGLIQDSTSEHGPGAHAEAGTAAQAPAVTKVVKQGGGSKGLAVAALIVGALGLAAGGYAVATRRS